LYGATDDSRFIGLNGVQAEKVKLNITKEFYVGRWAGLGKYQLVMSVVEPVTLTKLFLLINWVIGTFALVH
jgi:hypothetical protein